MLSRFDDYPIHQHAEPIAHTVSSDRFTYERFWYNGHAQDSSFYFGISLGRYPNLGVLDCSLSLVFEGRQYAFHGSRRAPDEPTELTIGPFTIEILEPMGRHRVVLAPNETGMACDLIFTPRTAPSREGRQTMRNARHLIMDVTRIDQFGFWTGSITCNGKNIDLAAQKTFGMKDRSWGIRPVGEKYTGGAPLNEYQPTHFCWLPIHWENECTLVGWFENEHGHQWHADQMILPAYPSMDDIPGVNDPHIQLWKGEVRHSLPMVPGTRRAGGGVITMSNGVSEEMEIRIDPPLLIHRMTGLGYQHPKWAHGKWQGELAIEAESWAVDEVDPLALENLHIQQVVTVRRGDEVGYGVLEEMHMGPYAPAGLKEWFDGA